MIITNRSCPACRPRSRRPAAAGRLAALLAGLAPAVAPAGEAAAAVRPIAACKSLGDAEARSHPRVTIRGVVTWRDEQGQVLFLEDETAGIYARFPRDTPEKRLPDDVQVAVEAEAEGSIGPGGFAPLLTLEAVRAIGPAPLPTPRPFVPSRFFAGADDGSIVEVAGVVRGVREEPFLWRVVAANESRVFEVECRKAAMPADFGQWCQSLIDGEVRFRGPVTTSFNARGESIAQRLFVSRPDWIEPVALADREPFAVRKVAIDAVARYAAEPSDDHMIRIEGTVVHALPGEALFLQEGHHGLRVLTRAGQAFAAGDRVEVAGFMDRGGTVAGLSEAVVRLVSRGKPPAPIDIAPDEVAKIHARSADRFVIADPGDYEGCLVRFPATLLERSPGRQGDLLVLAAGKTSVTARVTAGDMPPGRLDRGSRLLLTGILHVIPATEPLKWPLTAPTRMELVPRSAADIVILTRPSWWTPRRLAWALGLSAAVLAAALSWVAALRQQVGRQLAVIEAALEERAVTEERRRIAREFHDSLEQDMANVALQLDAAAGFAEGEIRDLLEEQRMLVARMQRETRQFVWDLRDPARSGWAFADLLAAQCREQGGRAAVPVEVEVIGVAVEPPRVARYHLLKIVGEAVSNAIRHGPATRVGVRLAGGPAGLVISVMDNGPGFDLETGEWREGHFGIRGMRERAQRIGAGLVIDTLPGRGTTVSIRLDPGDQPAGGGVTSDNVAAGRTWLESRG
jgi:signal transduction histidine kinase